MPTVSCRICHEALENFNELKSHWRVKHQREYVRVRTWLADVDEAVVVAECVVEAQEKGVDFGEKI